MFPRESQDAYRAFVLSTLFQREDCHLCVHPLQIQMKEPWMEGAIPMFLLKAAQALRLPHKPVPTLLVKI